MVERYHMRGAAVFLIQVEACRLPVLDSFFLQGIFLVFLERSWFLGDGGYVVVVSDGEK